MNAVKPRVFVTRRLPDPALAILYEHCAVTLWDQVEVPIPRAELLRGVAEAEGLLCLITDRIDRDVIAAAPSLRAVSIMAVGYDNIDRAALAARGITLTNTPDVLTETTADLAWALMLAAARRVVEGHKLIVNRGAGGRGTRCRWLGKTFTGER
jgi:Lactate dehydrogenase and related dehydrogenases